MTAVGKAPGPCRRAVESIWRRLPWLARFFGVSLAFYAVSALANYLAGQPLGLWTVLFTFPAWWLLGFLVGRGVTIDLVRRQLRPDAYMVGCFACGWRELVEDPKQLGPRRAKHAEFECPARMREGRHG